MNLWFFYIILLFLNIRSLTNVQERNALKIEAGKAFFKKNYSLSVQKYQSLANISYNLEPEARLNLAHAYFKINDTLRALEEYRKLVRLNDVEISTVAMIQVGVIETMRGDSISALELFKIALQKDDRNKVARYNYELLRKKIPQTPPKNSQSPTSDNENKTNTAAEAEKSEEKKDILDSMTPEKMSKEKALQLLESMKNSELQFAQKRRYQGSKNEKVINDW
ncbi:MULTISPECIES: hypothetical protein [Emticicia]|uniref:tetratricopeptide repeat protein n=1 Tax=Emticicia TaxID=312278 RepID=UPI0007D8B807|nr:MULTISPECIES: hypothetical protein [Emticicia]